MKLLESLERSLGQQGLFISGIVNARRLMPNNAKTVLLISPDEPRFWPLFKEASEWQDGAADPLDRWSRRVIEDIARAFGGTAYMPSDGPSYPPFVQWALASGKCWQSPVSLLVHRTRGLFISYRGAISVPEFIPSETQSNPCTYCEQPCMIACPVSALEHASYDVQACHGYLSSPSGSTCMTSGCQARRACPVGQEKRLPEQSAYHMRQFHR